MKNVSTHRLPRVVALALVAGIVLPVAPAFAQDAKAQQIIDLTKAQWAAENQNKPIGEAWASIADDYTEFNPVLPTRVDGKSAAALFYDATVKSGDVGVVSEMQNAKVQFYGDVAILTYNYAGMTKTADGKMRPDLAKSTRVYAKKDGKWMLVHANFAPVVLPD